MGARVASVVSQWTTLIDKVRRYAWSMQIRRIGCSDCSACCRHAAVLSSWTGRGPVASETTVPMQQTFRPRCRRPRQVRPRVICVQPALMARCHRALPPRPRNPSFGLAAPSGAISMKSFFYYYFQSNTGNVDLLPTRSTSPRIVPSDLSNFINVWNVDLPPTRST